MVEDGVNEDEVDVLEDALLTSVDVEVDGSGENTLNKGIRVSNYSGMIQQ